MSVERLIKDFGAEDVGAFLQVFREGKHTFVAKWIDANDMWVLTEEGQALLAEKQAKNQERKVVEKERPEPVIATPSELSRPAVDLKDL